MTDTYTSGVWVVTPKPSEEGDFVVVASESVAIPPDRDATWDLWLEVEGRQV